jgi:F-type H+-transporting ATPase subunit b
MRVSRIVPATLALLALSPLAVLAQEEGAAGGGAGIFNINLGLSVWTIVVFLGLVFILGRYAWPLILGPLEARESFIQGALDDAARQNEEARKLLEEQRKQLADARRQASELLSQGKAAGEKVRKEIEEKAREEAQAIVERAREEIGRERDAALDTLRRESVDLALAAAAHLLHQRLDQAEDRTLIERYLEELPESEGARA